MPSVCLLLEGTYPYVIGGVSACTHQLLSLLPNVTFDLVHISGQRQAKQLQYLLPPNVRSLQTVHIFAATEAEEGHSREPTPADLADLAVLHTALFQQGTDRSTPGLPEALYRLFVSRPAALGPLAQSRSRGFWHLIESEYCQLTPTGSFLDFFATWRAAHLPVYRLLSSPLPRADVYHALCAGYAGLLGVMAGVRFGAPFVLSEHGLYARERLQELRSFDAFPSPAAEGLPPKPAAAGLRTHWTALFRNMSRIAYAQAGRVTSLSVADRQKQICDGAPASRCQVIGNAPARGFAGLRSAQPAWRAVPGGTFRLGFVGRVVAVKDVKTLIRALGLVNVALPTFACIVAGPLDEDPAYVRECRDLVGREGLAEKVTFAGPVAVSAVYASLDLLVLTSLTEAQPLAILEANAAGVPVVATAAGGCRELLEGCSRADRALGPSGLLAEIGDASMVAACIMRIARSPALWQALSQAGVRRVRRFYQENRIGDDYGDVYRACSLGAHGAHAAGEQAWPG